MKFFLMYNVATMVGSACNESCNTIKSYLIFKIVFMRSQNLNSFFLYYTKVANIRDDISSILNLGEISPS